MRNPESAVHEYPSNVDFETLQRTASGLRNQPDAIDGFCSFFHGCGLPNEIITVFKSWTKLTPTTAEATAQGADFYSCFISYSHSDTDRAFAKRLHERLRARGIQCWMDQDHILPGDDIYDAIDEGIRRRDKVLLCCSRNSLSSAWVDREIDKALQKEEQIWRERKRKALTIIPLNLDGFIFEWNSGKASTLRSRFAADFEGWEHNDTKFEEQFETLVQALRADEEARPRVPESKL